MGNTLNDTEKILNQRVSGFHQYSLAEPIHLTYASQNLSEMLGATEAELTDESRDGYVIFVHPDDREKYTDFLGRLVAKEQTITEEYRMIRKDGVIIYVRDAASSYRNKDGSLVATSVLIDVTELYKVYKEQEYQRYINGLSSIYDKVYELNLDTNLVKCLHCQEGSSFEKFKDISMQYDDALGKWGDAYVVEEDRDVFRKFFIEACANTLHQSDSKLPQITYKAITADGSVKQYGGVFIKIDESISLYCCSVLEDAIAFGYKNNFLGEKNALSFKKPVVSIRTFGYFDVFVGEQPIAFNNKKSKELLALLVDRKGGYVTSEEAIGFLWEDESANSVTYSRYRKVALRLKNTLEEYGISHIVEAVDGKRRIVMENVDCDLYNYLSGAEEYAHLFKGSYLTNYSWGEITLGELMGNQL